MPEEIEQIINECSGHMNNSEYRELLEEIISDCRDRLAALDDDENTEE